MSLQNRSRVYPKSPPIKELRNILTSQSFGNFFNLSLNQGINVLVAVIVNPYLFQTLGEEQYGLVLLGLTVIMLISILVNYGFHLNGPKRLALLIQEPDQQSILINEILWTKLYLALILLGLLMPAIFVFNLFSNYALILSFSSIILIGEVFFPMFILQGFDRLSLLSKSNALSKLFYVAAIFAFVNAPEDAIWVNFIFGASSIIVNVILLIFIYRKWKIKLAWVLPSKVLVRLKENFQFFLSTIAGHVSVHGGYIILSNFVPDAELGRYGLAQRVAFLLRMIPVFLSQSILQHASRLYDSDKDGFDSYLNKSYKGGLVLTFFIGLIFSLLAPWVIRIVGGEFVDYSTNILRILCFIPFFGMLNVANMIHILVAERKDVLAKATWVTAIMMLILSALGSYYFGGYGLAVALLMAELFSFAVHYWLLKKGNETKD
jgi:O-antigen/teichoic acid export membrane protein